MSDKEHTIHDFNVSLICEYFSGMERQGPGSTEATVKALFQATIARQPGA